MATARKAREELTRALPRTSRLPLAIIFLSLLALGGLPIIGDRYVDKYRADVRDLVEPARNLTTEIHIALALGNSALRDYLNTQDTLFLQLFNNAIAREEAAHPKLAAISARLDTNVLTRYNELRLADARWHDRVAELLRMRPRNVAYIKRAFAEEQLYENTLNAAARLDDALAHLTVERRLRIDRAELTIRRLGLALATLAALAGVVALSLGRRLRDYATITEQSRAELEQVLASRARLARSITHDLKNPLGVIIGNVQLLEEGVDGPVTPTQHDRLSKLEKSASSMLGMIESLMEIERAKSGRLKLVQQPVDLGALVYEVAENHRAAVEGSGLELHVQIADNMGQVETDPERVRRVLDNLISNATKYTQKGFISVRAAPAPRDVEPGGWIAIAVQDSGRGIPEAQLEHIFDEFSRLETGAIPGTGLGLAVSRRVARVLGGDITLRSELGIGSTFTLWLPQEPPLRPTR